jgi:hypothetical protein
LLVLEMFKVIGHMGDGLESVMLGFISSILPTGNSICEKLKETSKTGYFFQDTIKSGHGAYKKSRVFEISACRKGCVCFIGQYHGAESCHICDETNDSKENQTIYYFPLCDRISKIINSDLRKMLIYPKIRRPSAPDFFEDVYDGENYKWFESQMDLTRYVVCRFDLLYLNRFSYVLPMFSLCFFNVLPMFSLCFFNVLPMFYLCFFNVLPMFFQCFIYVFPMFYLCFSDVFPMFFQYFIYVFPMFFQCYTYVFPMFLLCFYCLQL